MRLHTRVGTWKFVSNSSSNLFSRGNETQDRRDELKLALRARAWHSLSGTSLVFCGLSVDAKLPGSGVSAGGVCSTSHARMWWFRPQPAPPRAKHVPIHHCDISLRIIANKAILRCMLTPRSYQKMCKMFPRLARSRSCDNIGS